MALSLEEHRDRYNKNKGGNYIESMRLEGMSPPTSASPTHGMTKEEVIDYYKNLVEHSEDLPDDFARIVSEEFWDLI